MAQKGKCKSEDYLAFEIKVLLMPYEISVAPFAVLNLNMEDY